MNRILVILSAAIWISMPESTARAHHSHPYFYDWCRSVTVEGRIESVQWRDPHTVIVLKLDDGASYTVDWMPLNALTRDRIVAPAQAALVFGARVAVSGAPIRTAAQIREHFPDYTSAVNPRTIDPKLIRRVDDSWSWTMRPPQTAPDCTAR